MCIEYTVYRSWFSWSTISFTLGIVYSNLFHVCDTFVDSTKVETQISLEKEIQAQSYQVPRLKDNLLKP